MWNGAFVKGALIPGERVLVTGGSGGVGSATLQMLKAIGCEAIAITSSAEKAQFLLDMGADHVVVAARERGDGDADGQLSFHKEVLSTLGARACTWS